MAFTIHAYQLVRKAAAEDMKNVFAQPLPHQHKEASNAALERLAHATTDKSYSPASPLQAPVMLRRIALLSAPDLRGNFINEKKYIVPNATYSACDYFIPSFPSKAKRNCQIELLFDK